MGEKQLLKDADISPTNEVIAQGLGAANNAYIKFISEIKEYDIDVEWRYYNDGMAWLGKGMYRWTGARGGKKEVCAFWLSVWEGFFKVTVYIPEKARANALNLPFDDEVKEIMTNAKQIGKLKFFPVIFDLKSDKMLSEVYKLINFRKMI